MRRVTCFYLIVFIVSCTDKNQANYIFAGYPKELKANGDINNGVENSVFEFFNDDKNNKVSTGNYLNGLRNNEWYYNIDNNLIEIKWAPFKDKNLNFETNIFAIADTVFYGNFFTQIDYSINEGKISLVVAINSSLKDTLKSKGYKKIISTELEQLGYSLSKFDSTSIGKLPVFEYYSINESRNKKIYSSTTYGFVDKDFIQITVSCTGNVKKYKDILFEGVITNFFFNKKRLYYPFSST